jgi:hypothetical protein
MLRRVALVRTDVSEELSASFIRVTIIGELGSDMKKYHLLFIHVASRCEDIKIMCLVGNVAGRVRARNPYF